jgi:hypothetical protein
MKGINFLGLNAISLNRRLSPFCSGIWRCGHSLNPSKKEISFKKGQQKEITKEWE